MPNYTINAALGQELLHKMNGRNFNEFFVAHQDGSIKDSERKRASISRKPSSKQVLTIAHEDLICARVVSQTDNPSAQPDVSRYYIELMVRSEGTPEQIA